MAQLKNLIVTGPSNFLEIPVAPTAESGTSTTQLATTAFVNNEISGKESTSNKVTSISSSSTDTQYPSAKCVYDNVNSAFAKIPYGVVDSTSTATVFTATIPGITALEDGVCVFLRNGVISSTTGCTLNINGLGAKPIYYNMTLNTRVTTAFNVNYTYLFVYNSTVSISGVSGTGAWCAYYGYNSDGNGAYLRTANSKRTTKTYCGPYRILFSSPDNTQWIPATTSTSTNSTDLRDVTTEKINPFGRIVYYSSTAISANAVVPYSATYDQYPLTFGYSFNKTGGTANILTADAPVYIKCTPQDDDTAIIDPTTPYVQDLPSTEDGKIYIYLGRAYSVSAVEIEMHHPVYYYKDGAIRIWTGSSTDEDISRIESVTETALSDLEKKHQRNVKRIEDLEDGFEAIYDDIERIESATPKIELDEVPTSGSNNAVSSDGVYDALALKEDSSNKVTSISSSSTDTQYPSAKCIYDSLVKTTNQVTARSGATLSAGIIVGNSSGYINAAANVVFDQTYPILYYVSGLGYITYSGVTQTGALGGNEMWYLKCSKSGSTLTISSITSTVPQAADNYVYIPLGTSKTANKIEFRSSNQLFAFSDGYFQEIVETPALTYRETTGNTISLYEGEIVDCGTITNPTFSLIIGANDIGEYRCFFTCGASAMSITFSDITINWKQIPQLVKDNVYEISIMRLGDSSFYGVMISYE